MTLSQSFVDGKTLYLATKLTPAGVMTVTTDPGIDYGRLYLVNDNQVEWIHFTSVTPSGSYYILGGLTRDVDPLLIPMTSNSTGKTWLATQKCIIVAAHDQIFDAFQGGPFASYTSAQLSARPNKVLGETFYDTTLGSMVYWNGASYQSFGTGTFVNATTTSSGGVEIGTQTEVDNVVDNGSVGPLVVIPSTLDAKVMKQSSLVNSGITGEIKMWAASDAPTNWLLCDGSSVLRSTYSALFSVIGTTFGSVDGTHFNVPDFRGRSPLGSGTGTATGATAHALGSTPTSGVGGEEKHTLLTAEMPAHTHTIALGASSGGVTTQAQITTQGNSTATETTSSVGSDTAHNIMSPFTTVNFIIRI